MGLKPMTIEIKSLLGHNWIIEDIVTDTYVVRYSQCNNPCLPNSESKGKWLHAIKLDDWLKFNSKDKAYFEKYYGKPYLLHIAYGEVVGMQGWDIAFNPNDVLDFVEV